MISEQFGFKVNWKYTAEGSILQKTAINSGKLEALRKFMTGII